MAVKIIPKEQQGYGAFNGGEIVENNPLAFRKTIRACGPIPIFFIGHTPKP